MTNHDKRSIFVSTIILLLVACHAVRSTPQSIMNNRFEITNPANRLIPAIWEQDGPSDFYQLVSSSHSGKYSLAISYTDGLGQEGYAGTIQSLNASSLAGKSIEFSAFLKKSSADSKAGIWLLATDKDKKKLLYVNSYDQPIMANSAWKKHRLLVDLPAETAQLKLGAAIYESNGKMWVDDLMLSPVIKLKNSSHK
jgi:hypothetical protein